MKAAPRGKALEQCKGLADTSLSTLNCVFAQPAFDWIFGDGKSFRIYKPFGTDCWRNVFQIGRDN